MKQMRLAEAIRLGSLVLKPVPGLFDDRDGGGCALGMGNYSISGQASDEFGVGALEKAYPWINIQQVPVPCDCGINHWFERKASVATAIAIVFNTHVCGDHTWTIDRLCQWVDSIDPTPRETQTESTEPTVQTQKAIHVLQTDATVSEKEKVFA